MTLDEEPTEYDLEWVLALLTLLARELANADSFDLGFCGVAARGILIDEDFLSKSESSGGYGLFVGE